jgi:hypothetical protein
MKEGVSHAVGALIGTTEVLPGIRRFQDLDRFEVVTVIRAPAIYGQRVLGATEHLRNDDAFGSCVRLLQ